jgi:hypothetical protein
VRLIGRPDEMSDPNINLDGGDNEPGQIPQPMQAKSFMKANGGAPDPFDLGSMALGQEYLMKAGVTKLLTTVAVDKPKSQFFFRIHPDPEFRDVYGCPPSAPMRQIGRVEEGRISGSS